MNCEKVLWSVDVPPIVVAFCILIYPTTRNHNRELCGQSIFALEYHAIFAFTHTGLGALSLPRCKPKTIYILYIKVQRCTKTAGPTHSTSAKVYTYYLCVCVLRVVFPQSHTTQQCVGFSIAAMLQNALISTRIAIGILKLTNNIFLLNYHQGTLIIWSTITTITTSYNCDYYMHVYTVWNATLCCACCLLCHWYFVMLKRFSKHQY